MMGRFGYRLCLAVLMAGAVFGQVSGGKAALPRAEHPILTVYANLGAVADGPLGHFLPADARADLREASVMSMALFDLTGETAIMVFGSVPKELSNGGPFAGSGFKARQIDGKLVLTKGNPPEDEVSRFHRRQPTFAASELARLEVDAETIPVEWSALLKEDFGTSMGLPGVSLKELMGLKSFGPDIATYSLVQELSDGVRRLTLQVIATDSQTLTARLNIAAKPDSKLAKFVSAQQQRRKHDISGWKYVPASSGLVFLVDVDRAAASVFPEMVLGDALSQFPWSTSEQAYLTETLDAARAARDGQFLFATFDDPAAGPHAMLYAKSSQPDKLLTSWLDYQSLLIARKNGARVEELLAEEDARAKSGGFAGESIARSLEGSADPLSELFKALGKDVPNLLRSTGNHVGVIHESSNQSNIYQFLFSAKSAKGYNGSLALTPANDGLLGVAGGHGRTMLDVVNHGAHTGMEAPAIPASTWLGLWWTPSHAANEATALAPLEKALALLNFGQPLMAGFLEAAPEVTRLFKDLDEVDRVSLVSWAEQGQLLTELNVHLK